MRQKVTVIIPNYNHALYLPQRIESVLQQTYRDLEIILMDDCSPDNSRDIISYYAAKDSRIRVILNEHNSGSTFKQWNKGFGLARGEYIWIAESDDYAAPNFLEVLVQQLDNDPEVGLAYCNSAIVDEENNELNIFDNFYTELDPHLWTKDFVMDGRPLITKYMSYRNIFPNASAVVIRKSVIDKVGRADEKFRINGDWVFWASIIADTKVFFSAKKLNYFRHHLNNVRSKTLANGVALHEMSRVICVMQQYGTPDKIMLDKMLNTFAIAWVLGIIKNDIPIKTHLEIYRNISSIDKSFAKKFIKPFKDKMFSNNFSGLRQFLGDGLLYKYIKR